MFDQHKNCATKVSWESKFPTFSSAPFPSSPQSHLLHHQVVDELVRHPDIDINKGGMSNDITPLHVCGSNHSFRHSINLVPNLIVKLDMSVRRLHTSPCLNSKVSTSDIKIKTRDVISMTLPIQVACISDNVSVIRQLTTMPRLTRLAMEI